MLSPSLAPNPFHYIVEFLATQRDRSRVFSSSSFASLPSSPHIEESTCGGVEEKKESPFREETRSHLESSGSSGGTVGGSTGSSKSLSSSAADKKEKEKERDTRPPSAPSAWDTGANTVRQFEASAEHEDAEGTHEKPGKFGF